MARQQRNGMTGREHGIKMVCDELRKMIEKEFKPGEKLTREDFLAMVDRAEARGKTEVAHQQRERQRQKEQWYKERQQQK